MIPPVIAAVLLSGGIDSAACLRYFVNGGYSVTTIFIDYGQLAVERERAAAGLLAARYNVPLMDVRSGFTVGKTGVIQGRNALLVLSAFAGLQLETGLISSGIHAGTNYWDCTPSFINLMQQLLDGYSSGRVKLSCPFLTWTKKEVWDYCLAQKVPIELTYSCEAGLDQPCGTCISCDDRSRLLAG
jgi:7-cyano-7-deazaguanine synthase